MKKMIKIFTIISVSAISLHAGGAVKTIPPVKEIAPIQDATPYYVGVGVGAAGVTSFIYDTDTVMNVTLKAGYDFLEYVGLELRASAGVTDGDNLGYDYSYGLYIKPQYSINEESRIYALLGYAKTKITLDETVAAATGVLGETVQSGFSFGLGYDYTINNSWSAYVDAIRLIDESTVIRGRTYDTKVDTVTFGAAYHF